MCNNTGSEWCTSDIYAVLDITQLYTLSLHGSITIEQNIYGSYGSHASPVTPVGQVVHGRGCCRQPIRIHDRSHSPISYPWVFRDQSRHRTNMAALIVSEENCILLDKVQAVSDNMWKEHRHSIAGAKGGKACRYLSALNSHPEFPIFATALATMPALGNGITVSLWGDEEPLSMTLFNVNYSQTRKSRLGKISERMNRAVDAHIRTVLEKIFLAKERHQYNIKQKAIRDKEKERRKSESTTPAADVPNAAGPVELPVESPGAAVESLGTDDEVPISRSAFWDRFVVAGTTAASSDSHLCRSETSDTLMPRAEPQVVNNAGAARSHMCDLHDGRFTVQYIAFDMTAVCMMYAHYIHRT